MSTIASLSNDPLPSPARSEDRTDGDHGDASVYERIREAIISGKLATDGRLKVGELARRFGTSTNPVREALQQLRGEGFVVIEANRGARVRTIDEAFIRDICEIELMIEPALARWFADFVTEAEIAQLEAIQDEIEANDYARSDIHNELDTRFHRIIYDRHHNRHALALWWRHREILGAIGSRFPVSLARRVKVFEEHRAIIDALKHQDAERLVDVTTRHVRGSGIHLQEHMRRRQIASQ